MNLFLSFLLTFHTSTGLVVKVHDETISVNNKILYKLKGDEVQPNDKRNRLIENGGSAFLFLVVDGSPNEDEMHAFKITAARVTLEATTVASELRDLDGDSCLEFGGWDLNEVPPRRDSMYYHPSEYYEIRDGKIRFDSAFTKKQDIAENGVYLSHPLDAQGNCCKVIVKPGFEGLLFSERIDGPANLRFVPGGQVMFTLDDNVPVSTTDTVNKWYEVGLEIDPPSDGIAITKGSPLFSHGKQIGHAISDLPFNEEHFITGYTAMQNIKPQTQPEKILSGILEASPKVTMDQLLRFTRDFDFSKSDNGYRLDCGGVYGLSAPLRLSLVLDKGVLVAVVHQRKLDFKGTNEIKLPRGYILSVVGTPVPRRDIRLFQEFNTLLTRGD